MDDVRVEVSGRVLAQVLEALGHCELFIRSNAVVQAELVEFCLPRPGVTCFGLVEDLAWYELYLRTRLAEERARACRDGGGQRDV